MDNHLKILLMNANGPGFAEGKKRAVYETYMNVEPDLVFFQEFKWSSITSSAFGGYQWPSYLRYTGHQESSFLYDERKVVAVISLPAAQIQRWVDLLVGKGSLSVEFAPVARMCMRQIVVKSGWTAVCVSWHGRYRTGEKLEQFKNLMTFVQYAQNKLQLPFVIAGDFNIYMKQIKDYIPEGFTLHPVRYTERRGYERSLDFAITKGFTAESEKKGEEPFVAINLDTVSKEYDNLSFSLDHDPVVSHIIPTVIPVIIKKEPKGDGEKEQPSKEEQKSSRRLLPWLRRRSSVKKKEEPEPEGPQPLPRSRQKNNNKTS